MWNPAAAGPALTTTDFSNSATSCAAIGRRTNASLLRAIRSSARATRAVSAVAIRRAISPERSSSRSSAAAASGPDDFLYRSPNNGLDLIAPNEIVAEGVNALRSPERAMLVITHYQRLLNYIVPDRVHVLSDGRVARSGGPELALELEESGYAEFEAA